MTAADEDYGRRERLLLHHHPPTSASPAPPHGDRYIPPPAPAPGERYLPSDRYPSPGERYLGDRYIPPPAPADRYLPPPSAGATTPGGPGDPYMRRDLGYHHHYRLPAPSFHPAHHHPPHQYYHHQRTLPQAPQHHRPLSYHPHTPSRGHIRCCPSPSHYEQTPYLVSAAGSPGGSSSSGSSTTPPTSTASVVTSRDYGTSPSPLLPHRGRTPPCNVSQRLPSSPSATVTTPQQNPVVEYVGASGGRHVSTPTPTAPATSSVALPRCSSMSSCDVGVENPLCEHHPRRGCSGVLDAVEQGSTVSLCCGAGRRFAPERTSQQHPSFQQHAPIPSWRAVGQQPTLAQAPQQQGSPSTGTQQQKQQQTQTQAQQPEQQQQQQQVAQQQQQQQQPSSSSATPPLPAPTTQQPAPVGPPVPHAVLLEHPVQRPLSAPTPQHQPSLVHLDRSMSQPAPGPSQPSAPPIQRSRTKMDIVKQFIRRETAVFFGVEENHEDDQRARWLDRRKRLATRKYGQLKEEYEASAPRSYPRHRTTSAYATQQPPDVLPAGRDTTDDGQQATPRWAEPPGRRKESVAKMTFSGLAYLVARLIRRRPRPGARSRQRSRSFAPAAVPPPSANEELMEEAFFEKPLTAPSVSAAPGPSTTDYVDGSGGTAESSGEGGFATSRDQPDHHVREHYPTRERAPSWRRTPERLESVTESGPEVGCSRIWSRVLDRVFDNSDRRQYGMGIMGRMFGRSMKRSVVAKPNVRDQLDDIEDHRPFFTYWVTTVQVLILIISLACYGMGPVGIDLHSRSGQVLVTSLSLQQVDFQEPANFWLGPRAADLIHLGAKFAPCMRRDAKIIKEIEKGREKERETACCIRNDDSGCVQSSQADCSNTISTWKKWSAGDSGPGGRISGSVCGLDPKFCEAPASIAPYEWPDDITKWPICRKTNSFTQRFRYKDKMAEHMVCEVIGHPCCIGIHGTCRITTKEYCDFVRGFFHEEASLCSQVSCLDDVCGMIPFYAPELPDQFYRLWTSLFLHAGILHLALTLVIQYFLMRDLEKLTGSLRIAIIYMGSGVAGNLASAIFVPYRAEVGPAGAHFGLLSCLIVEVLQVWPMLRHPDYAIFKLGAITVVLFAFGFLPWVDNYAHLFGFIFGFLLSYALMPFISFGEYDRHKKIALIWVCLLSSLFLFAALVILFYVIPVYDCEVCTYFNCLPFTRDFCASQNINFKREIPVV